jgi:starch synthase
MVKKVSASRTKKAADAKRSAARVAGADKGVGTPGQQGDEALSRQLDTAGDAPVAEPAGGAGDEGGVGMEPPRPESVHIEEPLPLDNPPAGAAEETAHEPEPEPELEPGPEAGAPGPQPEPPVVEPQPAPPQDTRQGPSLYVVHVAPEMAPVAKVGGLADVVFGLSRELAIRGNHVEIILPKYDTLRQDQIHELQVAYQDLWVPWYDGTVHCTVYFGFVHERKCFFIEPHSKDNFFSRGSIYGFADDVLRYAFFSRAAVEFLFKAGKHPDIIHCHDWQSALVPVFLYEIYQHLGMTHPRVCLTIHNFAHQGLTGMEMLKAGGLHKRPEHFFDYNRLRDNHNPYALNLLKGGIVYSNFVTTVSPRYAYETQELGEGMGLEPTLYAHHMKYGGVVNGIDYDVWNPEVDRHIPVRYGIENLDEKYANKRALRQRLMLADNEKPIVAFIGRLDPQKGLELVRHGIFYALERGAQFVLLGSSPDASINRDFWGLKRMLNDSPDCHLEIGFDEDLSHLIYAGADMLLVPSRFEPCGLTQLIALRYGTIPVVRAVGGLADTVFDKDHANRPLHERNGYVFRDYDNRGLESALGRAVDCYFHHPAHFRDLMKNAMRSDYSWNVPGRDYLNIYDYIRSK